MKRTYLLTLAILIFSSCGGTAPIVAEPATPSADVESIKINVGKLLESYAHYDRFSGAVLIAYDDSIWYQNSFGYADIENGVENSNSSVYGIGSVTKQFTATAILKLVQDGRLELTDKLSDYFPALGETVSHITIHHLLSMSSGIYEDFSRSKTYDIESIIFPEPHPISTSALVHYFGELTSDSKPGKSYDYSNMNYILLAAIVEKVSGQDYGEFLKENFWQKLGMTSTTFGSENVQEDLLAKPYIGLPSHHKTPNYWHDSWVLGAGGAFSSAQDIHSWMVNIANRNVLDSLNTNKLFRKQISTGSESYAYGWQIGMRKGNEYRYHDGGTLGYVCEAGFFPEHNIYMVVLTNHTHDLMEIGKSVRLNKTIVSEIQNILFDEPFTTLPIPKKNSTISLSGNFNIGAYNYEISQGTGNVNILTKNNGPSILDLPFWQDLTEDTKRFKKAEKIAVAFGEENFGYVRSKSDFLMKTLISTKKLAGIWNEITGDKGQFKGYNFYRIPGEKIKSSYWVRLVHEKKEIGLRLSFNKRGRMMGMHIDQSFSFGGPVEVKATVIDNTSIFVDGFKYGYPDAYIIQKQGNWILKTGTAELLIEK